jgi:uncharacterized protein YqhQ
MEPQSYIGGQAVIEGVMMRNGNRVAVAVRKSDRTIHVDTEERVPWTNRALLHLPILRGSAILFESLVTGIRALNQSSAVSADEEEEQLTGWQLAGTLLFSLAFAAGLFLLLPLYAAEWLTGHADGALFAVMEGVIRLGLFLAYILLIARLDDIQRVFQYHGAEHKTINCYEAGEELSVANVRRHTMMHKRCGTSFLLFVMVISIVAFSFLSGPGMAQWERLLYRLLLMPVVAGLSYELIRFSGGTDSRWVTWLVSPGMLLQRLTTREPDDEMIEVAIASVQAVVNDGKLEEVRAV